MNVNLIIYLNLSEKFKNTIDDHVTLISNQFLGKQIDNKIDLFENLIDNHLFISYLRCNSNSIFLQIEK